MCGLNEELFFETTGEEKEAPKVQFQKPLKQIEVGRNVNGLQDDPLRRG